MSENTVNQQDYAAGLALHGYPITECEGGRHLDGQADARIPEARLRELFAEYETCFDISREPV
jgi:hypothetical protein